ncbi:hypothetical protein CFT13S00388_07900 [Campylobacter fetus subsp. testudinum]|uniref:hypothetical protein n=1 Tax=Campylobacter fetus TaxID=196 RepID=UPI000818AD0D|nr:hypothetical protein [Campylobacter fetus]OCR86673.1 hypothetical protein CFT13S00388_07900 [Campylobacter fetus subsp. testudinum]
MPMSLRDLSYALVKIDGLNTNEPSRADGKNGFDDIFDYIAFNPENYFGEEYLYNKEKLKDYINNFCDDVFEGYKVGDKGFFSDDDGDFVVEFEIVDNSSLFEEAETIEKLFGIMLNVHVPLDLIKKCEEDLGYVPFAEYL